MSKVDDSGAGAEEMLTEGDSHKRNLTRTWLVQLDCASARTRGTQTLRAEIFIYIYIYIYISITKCM